MDLTDNQRAAIIEWAKAQTSVHGVRLFGSRAKGTSRLDSDIDLALTVEERQSRRPDADGYTVYFFEKDNWATELTALTGLPVHVERYHTKTNPNVFRFCGEHSILLWERP